MPIFARLNNQTYMTANHARKARELDPRGVTVHFPAGVRNAFRDLAAAVHFSDQFDQGTLQTVEDLAAGKALSVEDVIGSLPLLAEHTFKHVHVAGDERAKGAWHAIGDALLEEGFTLTKWRGRNK